MNTTQWQILQMLKEMEEYDQRIVLGFVKELLKPKKQASASAEEAKLAA